MELRLRWVFKKNDVETSNTESTKYGKITFNTKWVENTTAKFMIDVSIKAMVDVCIQNGEKNLPDKLEELKSATSPKMFEENADKWLRHSIYETQKGRPFSFLTSIILIGLHGQNKQTLQEGFVCSVFVVFIYSLRMSGLL